MIRLRNLDLVGVGEWVRGICRQEIAKSNENEPVAKEDNPVSRSRRSRTRKVGILVLAGLLAFGLSTPAFAKVRNRNIKDDTINMNKISDSLVLDSVTTIEDESGNTLITFAQDGITISDPDGGNAITTTTLTIGGVARTTWPGGAGGSPFESDATSITAVEQPTEFIFTISGGILYVTVLDTDDITGATYDQTLDMGTDGSFIFGDNSDTATLNLDGTNVNVGWSDGDLIFMGALSESDIFFQPNNITADYLVIKTVVDTPMITTAGSCDLDIQPDGGDIDFGATNLVTTGTLGCGVLTASSYSTDLITSATYADTLTFTDDQLTYESDDTHSIFAVYGDENDMNASLLLASDNSDASGDDWKFTAVSSGNALTLGNDISGSQVTKWTITTAGSVTQAGDVFTLGDGEYFTNAEDDRIKVSSNDAAMVFEVWANVASGTAGLQLSADQDADAGDSWLIEATASETLTFANDSATADNFVTVLTLDGTNSLITSTADVLVSGTTPRITVGDGGAENSAVVLDNEGTAWYSAVYDTDDSYQIGEGTVVNTNPAIKITTSTLATEVLGDLTVSGGDLTMVSGVTSKPALSFSNTYDGTTGVVVTYNSQDGSSAADAEDGDDIATFNYTGYDDGTPTADTYVSVLVDITDSAVGATDGSIAWTVVSGSSDFEYLALDGIGGIEFNAGAEDINFRYDGDTTADFFYIDAGSEFVSVGKAASYAVSDWNEAEDTPRIQTHASANNDGITITTWTTTATEGGGLYFATSDHATIGTHAAMEDDDVLGGIYFNASDASEFQCAAAIVGKVDDTTTTGDTPGKLMFYTSADSGDTPTLALTIDMAQKATFAGDMAVNGGDFTMESITGGKPLMVLESTESAVTGAILTFLKDRDAASGAADGDDLGTINFTGDDAGTTATSYAQILGEISSPDNTDESGKLTLSVMVDGTSKSMFMAEGEAVSTAGEGRMLFNEDNVDIDITFETVNDATFLVLDSNTSAATITSTQTSTALAVVADSVTTGNVATISADGLTTGVALQISSTATTNADGTLIELRDSGTGTGTPTRIGIDIGMTGTGTTSTNTAAKLAASGGDTNNIALFVEQGDINFGDATYSAGTITMTEGASSDQTATMVLASGIFSLTTDTGDIELVSGGGQVDVSAADLCVDGAKYIGLNGTSSINEAALIYQNSAIEVFLNASKMASFGTLDLTLVGDLDIDGDGLTSNGDLLITPGGSEVHINGGLDIGGTSGVGDNNLNVVGTSAFGAGTTFQAGDIVAAELASAAKTFVISAMIADISTADDLYIMLPKCTVIKVLTCLEGAVSAADATVELFKNSQASSLGTITIAQSGSAVGTIDSLTPSSNNTFNGSSEFLWVTGDGGSTDTKELRVSIVCTGTD